VQQRDGVPGIDGRGSALQTACKWRRRGAVVPRCRCHRQHTIGASRDNAAELLTAARSDAVSLVLQHVLWSPDAWRSVDVLASAVPIWPQ
jgi:hypothetical protein